MDTAMGYSDAAPGRIIIGARKVSYAATAFAVGSLFAVLPAGVAHAHASLSSSVPAAGEVLSQTPEELALTFNETVVTDAQQISLLDGNGKPVEVAVSLAQQPGESPGLAETDVTVVTLTPKAPLAEGPWVVSWVVVSADGHLVSGLVDFAVAANPGSSPEALSPSKESSQSAHAARQGHDSGSRNRAAEVPSRVLEGLGWLAAAAAGMLLAGSLSRRLALTLATGGAAAAFLYTWSVAGALGDLSLGLKVGEVRAGVAVLACGAVAAVACALPTTRARRAGGALAVTAFAAQGLWSGHHLLTAFWLVTAAHVVHLAAAAAWVGAVVALAARLDPAQAQRTRRQSTAAIWLLIPSALILAVWTSGAATGEFSWGEWTYVLLTKLAVVLAALAIGLVNHRALAPARVENTLRSRARLSRFLAIELSALAVAAAASATLTLYTPPTAVHSVNEALATAGTSPSATATCAPTAADLQWPSAVSVRLADGSQVAISVASPQTGPVAELSMAYPEGNESTAATLVATHSSGAQSTVYLEPAQGELKGQARLPLAGHWMLEAEIPVDAFTVSAGTGHLDIEEGTCVSDSATLGDTSTQEGAAP